MTSELKSDADAEEADALLIKRTRAARRRENWVGWTSVAANIIGPIAILLAGLGLWEQTREAKRNAAAQQINLLNSQGLANAQKTLFSLWNRQDLSVLENPLSRQFIDAFVTRTIAATDINPEEVITAIVALAAYFDRVERCIQSGRCDVDEVLDQVGHYGRDFHCLYSGQIEALRRERMLGDLGMRLAAFAERAGGCSQAEEPET
jgi:hypothetical protein